jgi:hypothetical protein
MTRVASRATLHDARLLHFLSQQGFVVDTSEPVEVGQKLSDWLDFRHAIALQGLLDQTELSAQHTAPAARIRINAQVLHTRFDEVRLALECSITKGIAPAPRLARIAPPDAQLLEPIDPKTAFEPYRRYLGAHQRQMESVIAHLRAQLRSMLAQGEPHWQQLGLLDAAMDTILQTREKRLLTKLSSHFEKRFNQQLKKHIKASQEAHENDSEQPNTDIWLPAMCQAMQAALLHELDIRLQPVQGLIEALTYNKNTSSP